jgi:hypothetical protein
MIISISTLLWVTYLLVFNDWDITLPNPNVSFINSKTFTSIVLCVITKAKSPLLLTIKDPSPSENPMNQAKKFSEGGFTSGKWVLNFL